MVRPVKVRTVHRRPSYHRKRHGLPFNFLSGFIYTAAVILSIALGAMFYKGVKSAHVALPVKTAEPLAEVPDLPPGAKVVVKQEKAAPAPPARPPPAPPKEAVPPALPAAPPAAPAAPPPAPTPAEAVEAEPRVPPEPRILPRSPWAPLGASLPQPHTITIVPSADTTIFAAPAALRSANLGGHDELILKGHESFALARYDLAPIAGWTIRRAVWRAKVKRGLLREVAFSTIMADWEEGTGTLEKKSSTGATYFSAPPEAAGAAPGSAAPILHVVYGNGGSLFCVGTPDLQTEQSNEWISVEMDPVLVQAHVADAAYGIAIFDAKGQFSTAPVGVFSRETNDSHYLEVEGQLVDIEPPGEIRELAAHEHPFLRGRHGVGALLTWIAPGDDGQDGQAFKYDVRYGAAATPFDKATAVPRSRIPYPQPAGQRDQIVIEGLDPDTRYTFFLRAVDEAGQAGPVATATFQTPARFTPPKAATPEPFKPQSIGLFGHALTLEICDEYTGVDPVSGTRFGSLDPATARTAPTYIWDRDARAVHLRAAQNEYLGFTIVIGSSDGNFPPLKFSNDPFQSTAGEISARDMTFYRVDYHYAGGRGPTSWRGDALVPLDGFMTVPSESQKKMGSQAFQSVFAEMRIPETARPGLYRSKLTVQTTEGNPESVNLFLTVLPIRLPDRPRFTVELLARPGLSALYKKNVLHTAEARPVERAYQRLAAQHRCTLAYVPYSSAGECPQPFAPPVTGGGLDLHVTSWEAWDERFGLYLDGRAFEGLPGGWAAGHMILPLFENWPSPLKDAYRCADGDAISPRWRAVVFGGPSDQIRECLDRDYWRALRAAAQQFAEHFAERGWDAVGHVWLCNTPTNRYEGRPPPWSFGQPESPADYMALEAYAEALALRSSAAEPHARVRVRVHVPDGLRLQDYGGGLFDLLCVSDPDAEGWRRLRERAATYHETLWRMTDALPLEPTPLPVAAEAVAYFLEGADGWSIRNTLGLPGDWARASPASLFYHGAALNSETPASSLRLKAIRRAQQDIELLILLQREQGWSRQQLAEFVRQYVPDRPGSFTSNVGDWYRLRYAAQELLAH